jgi:hypothetical protein
MDLRGSLSFNPVGEAGPGLPIPNVGGLETPRAGINHPSGTQAAN